MLRPQGWHSQTPSDAQLQIARCMTSLSKGVSGDRGGLASEVSGALTQPSQRRRCRSRSTIGAGGLIAQFYLRSAEKEGIDDVSCFFSFLLILDIPCKRQSRTAGTLRPYRVHTRQTWCHSWCVPGPPCKTSCRRGHGNAASLRHQRADAHCSSEDLRLIKTCGTGAGQPESGGMFGRGCQACFDQCRRQCWKRS